MWRQKLSTLINVVGLALGITCTILIYLIVSDAASYNSFYDNKDQLYRVVTDIQNSQGSGGTPGVPPPLPDALKEDLDGIDNQAFISAVSNEVLIRVGDNVDNYDYHQLDERVAYTEPAYFDLFQPPIISGSYASFGLTKKVVIAERIAERLFPGEEAVGRVLSINNKDDFEIVAVMENPPENTDIPFEMLISYETIREDYLAMTGWGSVSSDDQVYVMLEKGVSSVQMDNQLVKFVKKNFPNDNPGERSMRFQPLSEWHEDDRYTNYSYNTFSKTGMISMSLVAVFLIITACVNFINLKTALTLRRTREIGIRKVMGSSKGQLIFQFFGETFITVLIATILSLGLSELLLLDLNEMLGASLHISLEVTFVLFLLLLMIVVTLLAGFYPSRIIAHYQPALALKNIVSTSGRKESFLRKSLVTFQFFISQFFIIGTIVLISQMDYLDSLDLGFRTDSIINIRIPAADDSKKKVFKTSLENIPAVEYVSLVNATPASGSVSVTDYDIGTENTDLLTAVKMADKDYFDLYEIPFLAGEGLLDSDTLNRLVVNETWVLQSGFDSPADALGAMVDIWGRSVPVSGVVRDFHTVSAHDNIQPVVIISSLGNTRMVAIKISGTRLNEVITEVGKKFKEVYPEYTYDYEFLDEYIGEFYESERDMARTFTFFALVAIVIGMLGLFGLIAFTTERRLKEIGVRKVLGATMTQIFVMFSWDVIKLVAIAFLFAAPLAWFAMTRWLENYQYRIDLNGSIFLIGLGLTVLISMATISYRSLQVAYTNPADTLRTE